MIDSFLPLFSGLAIALYFLNVRSLIAMMCLTTIMIGEKAIPNSNLDFFYSMMGYTMLYSVAALALILTKKYKSSSSNVLKCASVVYILAAITPIMSMIEYNPFVRIEDIGFYSNWTNLSTASNVLLFALALVESGRGIYDRIRSAVDFICNSILGSAIYTRRRAKAEKQTQWQK